MFFSLLFLGQNGADFDLTGNVYVLPYKDNSLIENLSILLAIIKIRHVVPFLIILSIIGSKEKVTISSGIYLLFHP